MAQKPLRPVAELWNEFRTAAETSGGRTPEQTQEVKAVFYSGAFSMYYTLHALVGNSRDAATVIEGFNRVKAIFEELEEFRLDMIAQAERAEHEKTNPESKPPDTALKQ